MSRDWATNCELAVYVLDEQLRPRLESRRSIYRGSGADEWISWAARSVCETISSEPACVPTRRKIYWTGDLVRWRADGALEYLGRRDQQGEDTGIPD